jgi:hypothetical protein
MSGTASARSAGTNCGRNAKKKIVSFGLRVFTRIPEMTRHGDGFSGSASMAVEMHRKWTRHGCLL